MRSNIIYNWSKYTKKSDLKYQKALVTGDTKDLFDHNILKDGHIEVKFIEDLVNVFFSYKILKNNALDVCCGVGYMTQVLKSMGFKTIGFDINKDAISIAKLSDPKGKYYNCDAVYPDAEILNQKYDLIMIREAHPLSRIRNDNFQNKFIQKYLKLLNPGGVCVISHARKGGGMFYPSLSFKNLKKYLVNKKYKSTGPHFIFFYKHFKIESPSKLKILILSVLSKIFSIITSMRHIEFFIIQAPKNFKKNC